VQPLAGMNTASDKRYEVTASLSASGLVPMSVAIAGSDVAITVESMFSMNRATVMISGTMRSRGMGIWCGFWRRRFGLQPAFNSRAVAERGPWFAFITGFRRRPRNRRDLVLSTHANPKAGREVGRGLPRQGHFISLRQPALSPLRVDGAGEWLQKTTETRARRLPSTTC